MKGEHNIIYKAVTFPVPHVQTIKTQVIFLNVSAFYKMTTKSSNCTIFTQTTVWHILTPDWSTAAAAEMRLVSCPLLQTD